MLKAFPETGVIDLERFFDERVIERVKRLKLLDKMPELYCYMVREGEIGNAIFTQSFKLTL